MKKLKFLFLLMPFYLMQATEQLKFKLITFLFNETNQQRIDEYITCIEKNLAHKCIDKVHVIYDPSKDSANNENKILNYLKSKNIEINYVAGRPSFKYCFDLANKNYPNSKIILINADIYFNETLNLLMNYDLTNKFLPLTRWNVKNDGKLELFDIGTPWNGLSHDCWIFQTPIRTIMETDIFKLGTWNVESIVSYYANKSGLTVLNPCLTIQACHLHNSQIKHYVVYATPNEYLEERQNNHYMKAEWKKL
jgi:hypothetical protein